MAPVMGWLERTPWWILAAIALAFAIVPPGESHFLEKWSALFSGTLRRPLDWFDLVFHSAPLALLVVKVALSARRRRAASSRR